MNQNSPSRTGLFARHVGLLVGLACVGCTGAGVLGSIALDAGRKMFLSTAEQNFSSEYNASFEKLLDQIAPRQLAVGGAASTATPAGATSFSAASAASSAPPAETAAVEEPAPAAASAQLPAANVSAPPGAQAAPTGQTPAPVRAQGIELEVAVLREVQADGRYLLVPMEDGEIVRDGVGRVEQGDNLRIHFKTNVDCYVYVVWVDATAWATPLFPHGPNYNFENPVRAGRAYELPGNDDAFFLDDYRGAETLYLIASHEPMPEMQEVLNELGRMTRSFRADLEAPAALAQTDEVLRGIGGVRKGTTSLLAASDGSRHKVESKVFLAQFAESDLVVTRWLWHE